MELHSGIRPQKTRLRPGDGKGREGKVDVVITIRSKTFGHSVDSRISVEMLQRIAGNAEQITSEGYRVPIVTQGEGYIGCLCDHDQIPRGEDAMGIWS
jgi:hypothetical protein